MLHTLRSWTVADVTHATFLNWCWCYTRYVLELLLMLHTLRSWTVADVTHATFLNCCWCYTRYVLELLPHCTYHKSQTWQFVTSVLSCFICGDRNKVSDNLGFALRKCHVMACTTRGGKSAEGAILWVRINVWGMLYLSFMKYRICSRAFWYPLVYKLYVKLGVACVTQC